MLRNRIGLAIWGVLVIAYYVATRSFFSVIMLMATVVVTLFSVVSVMKSRHTLQVTLESPHQIKKNKKKSISLILQNTGAYPIFSIKGQLLCENRLTQEKTEIPFQSSLKGYMKEEIPVKMNSAFCGCVDVTVKELVVADMLGILSYHQETTPSSTTLVRPELSMEVSEDTVEQQVEITGEHDGDERFGIKEYTEGAPVSHMHWKLSEKLDTLVMRETIKEGKQVVNLFLETELDEGHFANLPREASERVEVLFSMSHQLLAREAVHGIIYFDSKTGQFSRYEISTEDDLEKVLPELLAVKFFCGESCGTCRRYVEDHKHQCRDMLYITDEGITQYGEWVNEQRITPVFGTKEK